MDIRTFIIAILLGFFGGQLMSLLNYADGGAIIAIAYVGSRIIWKLSNSNTTENLPTDTTN